MNDREQKTMSAIRKALIVLWIFPAFACAKAINTHSTQPIPPDTASFDSLCNFYLSSGKAIPTPSASAFFGIHEENRSVFIRYCHSLRHDSVIVLTYLDCSSAGCQFRLATFTPAGEMRTFTAVNPPADVNFDRIRVSKTDEENLKIDFIREERYFWSVPQGNGQPDRVEEDVRETVLSSTQIRISSTGAIR